MGNVVLGGYWSKTQRAEVCEIPSFPVNNRFRLHIPVLTGTFTSITPQLSNIVPVHADSIVPSSSVLWLWKDGVLLKLGQSLASQEHHAHRRSRLVLGQMCSSAEAVKKSMSSVVKTK